MQPSYRHHESRKVSYAIQITRFTSVIDEFHTSESRRLLHLIFRLTACTGFVVAGTTNRGGSPLFCRPCFSRRLLNRFFQEYLMKRILIVALALCSIALAQEKKIQRADLPPAVEKTVATQSAGATVRGFSQEKEKGQTYYEAEMTVSGHSKDVLLDVSGAVVEV